MKKKVSIFWFRRDLRLHDNAALSKALDSKYPVVPVFIFDSEILAKLSEEDPRVSFIYENIKRIQSQLKEIGSSLGIYLGKPFEVFSRLLKEFDVSEVFTNKDYEPYARERDSIIYSLLSKNNIPFHNIKDQVIFQYNEILKKDGEPYVVYSPYMRLWKQELNKIKIPEFASPGKLNNFFKDKELQQLTLKEIGFSPSPVKVPRYDVSTETLKDYEHLRNFPAKDATTHLGPYLRFGIVSIREIVKLAVKEKNETFLQELIWREFFMQILYHFPHTVTQSFKKKYDRIPWRNNEEEFQLWKEGKTGYPLVDAGMRQMNTTGFMHNRVRMLVASFLCKHLLIDWRWGEAYFAEKLLDFELASNIGNWQWAAGSGVDAAPYFRIFNPTTQIKNYDKDLEYVRKWVKEYDTIDYPERMVDHKEARERALKIF